MSPAVGVGSAPRLDGRDGFTLIEVLAVVLLTAIVLSIVTNFMVTISRGSARASDQTRDIRRAVAILDRIARDLEGATLVQKPAETDPLSHPWVFLGESRYSETGADHLKFITRNHRPDGNADHQSDLAVVAYSLRQSEDGDGFELMRWASPRLPIELDREIPRSEDRGAQLMADGIASFGVTFVSEAGDATDRWDSSLIERSSELPIAADIQVAMLKVDAEGEPYDGESYIRRVILPVRPLDLVALLDPETGAVGGGADEEEVDEDGDGVPDNPRGRAGGSAGDQRPANCAAWDAALRDPNLGEAMRSQMPAECR